MPNVFYDPGDQRAAKVRDLFARIAPRYDLINDLQSFGLHRFWKRRVIELACVKLGCRALDLCCGTGDLAFRLASRGAAVTALDFSPQMLEIGTRKYARTPINDMLPSSPTDNRRAAPGLGAGRVDFIRGDAQQLPFADQAFDIVTMGYGLRNLAQWETGLHEMRRVTRPAGRVVILDFGKPDNALLRGLYFTYLRLGVPVFGQVFCGNAAAYSYILESLKHYAAQHEVAEKMRALDFVNVRVLNLLGGVMSINFGQKPA